MCDKPRPKLALVGLTKGQALDPKRKEEKTRNHNHNQYSCANLPTNKSHLSHRSSLLAAHSPYSYPQSQAKRFRSPRHAFVNTCICRNLSRRASDSPTLAFRLLSSYFRALSFLFDRNCWDIAITVVGRDSL